MQVQDADRAAKEARKKGFRKKARREGGRGEGVKEGKLEWEEEPGVWFSCGVLRGLGIE